MELKYKMQNGYRVLDLDAQESENLSLGKYADLRRAFLMEFHPFLYDRMELMGTLHRHLQEMQETIEQQVAQTMTAWMQQNPCPYRPDETLAWSGWMMNLHNRAEELAMETLYSI